MRFSVLLNIYFKTTCSIRPHVYGLMGGVKIKGPLYCYNAITVNSLVTRPALPEVKELTRECIYNQF